MRTCRPFHLACLAIAALAAGQGARAGGFATAAPAAVAPKPAAAHARVAAARVAAAHPRSFSFMPASLRDLITLRLPSSPVSLLPAGWEPAASSSHVDDLHRTTIDLGLRRQFSGHSSAQLGARITVLDCISIDPAGRFALGDSGSKVHGLVGFTYRY